MNLIKTSGTQEDSDKKNVLSALEDATRGVSRGQGLINGLVAQSNSSSKLRGAKTKLDEVTRILKETEALVRAHFEEM